MDDNISPSEVLGPQSNVAVPNPRFISSANEGVQRFYSVRYSAGKDCNEKLNEARSQFLGT